MPRSRIVGVSFLSRLHLCARGLDWAGASIASLWATVGGTVLGKRLFAIATCSPSVQRLSCRVGKPTRGSTTIVNGEEVRVVVVDDVADAAQILAAYLELDGYKVAVAGDGVEALAVVERHRPHCVLLDILMPGGDGCELSRNLRALYGDDVVLVAVTGFDEQDQLVAETFATVDHYLRKPVEPSDLRRLLPALM
jgi:CheY-like chemotaxis protein